MLDGIYWASKGLDAAFSVGGTLGRLPVALAVSAAPALSQVQAQRPGGPAGKSAQVVLLPGGGEADLQTLLALCTPAAFGRGQATGKGAAEGSAGVHCLGQAPTAVPQQEQARHDCSTGQCGAVPLPHLLLRHEEDSTQSKL